MRIQIKMITAKRYKILNAWVCRIEGMEIIPQFGDLEIIDGIIGGFTERKYPDFKNTGAGDGIIDAGGRVATVPLVNFHDHIYSRLAIGLPVTGTMGTFMEILENLWWRLDRSLDREMIAACARLAMTESIRNGVTYLFDHHASPAAAPGSLSTIADILQTGALRAVLCYETSDRNGELSARQGFEENARFIREEGGKNIKGMLGLHAPFTLSDASLKVAGKLVRQFSTGIHIHLAEDRYEVEYSYETFGISPVRRLLNQQLLNDKSIIAHGVHLGPADLKLVAGSGSAIVLNPDSNLNNSVGLPNFASIPGEIPLLAGTDGMHASISRSLKQLFLLYRMQGNGFDAAFAWIRKIYFDQVAFVRRWLPDFPGLCAGDRTDLILWDYVPPTPVTSENFWGHFIYGILESPVHTVIQNGRPLMINHRLEKDLAVDAASVFRQGDKLFKSMHENHGKTRNHRR